MKKHIALAGLLIVMANTSGLYANCSKTTASDRIYWYDLDMKTQRAILQILRFPNWKECKGSTIALDDAFNELSSALSQFRATQCASKKELFKLTQKQQTRSGFTCATQLNHFINQVKGYFASKHYAAKARSKLSSMPHKSRRY